MSNVLITPTIKDLDKLLERTSTILKTLSHYPFWNLENCLSSDIRIGNRSFFWMAYAVYELSVSRQLKQVTDGTLLRLNDYFVRHYAYSDQVRDKVDPFWFISSCQAFSIIWHLNNAYGHDVSVELLRDGVFEYQQSSHRLSQVIETSKRGQWHDWYLSFWAIFAFDWISEIKDSDESTIDISAFLQESQNRLEKQIVFHQIKMGGFNQLELAMAARILWNRNNASNKFNGSTKVLDSEISKAVSICCEKSSRLIEKRLVQITRDYGELHNLPWEDLFVLLDLPAHIFPEDLTVFGEILDYLEARFVEVQQGEEFVIGMTEESSPRFPEPASYFTNYAIVFLGRLERLIQNRLRDLLVKNVRLINSSHVVDVSDKTNPLDWKSIYETQENTFGVFKDKLSCEWQVLRSKWSDLNTILLFGPSRLERSMLIEVLLRHLNSYNDKKQSLSAASQNQWISITLIPGNFLVGDSFGEILNTISDIFLILSKIDRCVFLMEDAEELLQTRSSEGKRLERILTAATLLNLKKLKWGQSIYIFSTTDIQKIDASATRKGSFSIRKGLGWVHDSEIQRLVVDIFPSVSKDVKFLLSRNLSCKSIEEILDIKHELESRFSLTQFTETQVELYFKQTWKNYFSEEIIQQHIENCDIYDDNFQKKN